jgi:hypothetical protein
MTDEEFVRAFESCELPNERFHHRDHVRLTFLYLRRGNCAEATAKLAAGIRRYANHLGASAKYHETLTVAWTRLVDKAMQETPELESFDEFVARHVALLDKNSIGLYYSPGRLAEAEARTRWVEPDLRPLW